MVAQDPNEAIEQRDQAFQRLSDLTKICFFWSGVLLALFSGIAAVTIPGQSQNIPGTTPNLGDTSAAPTTDDDQPLPGPGMGTLQPGGGRPIAVPGGSC